MIPKTKLTKPSPATGFSHLDASGAARMVDVGHKPLQRREAVATGVIHCLPATIRLLKASALPKGDVLATARLSGIMAAKRTAEWIPLCHTLPLDKLSVDFKVKKDHIVITAVAATHAKTGVEMEALVAVSAAALTLYDMMKAVDKSMLIDAIHLLEKTKQ